MKSFQDLIQEKMKRARIEKPKFTPSDLTVIANGLVFDDLTGWIADVMKLNPAIYKDVINKLRVEKIKTILED